MIRDSAILNVILVDYAPSSKFEYPPIYQRPKDSFELIEDWTPYLNVPIFLWYPR